MKDKETLQEACKRLKKELDYSEFDYTSFKLGIKWQQEKDNNKYSLEDIINALHSVELKDNKDYSKIYKGMKKWFEQNKNK